METYATQKESAANCMENEKAEKEAVQNDKYMNNSKISS